MCMMHITGQAREPRTGPASWDQGQCGAGKE
jgi:hypothetical protein